MQSTAETKQGFMRKLKNVENSSVCQHPTRLYVVVLLCWILFEPIINYIGDYLILYKNSNFLRKSDFLSKKKCLKN